ncbi:hypothetical protein C4J95_1501 [Pseudomonas orientalis]|nr:hypothetical protein C4J98_1481 [Pseudomonas orientalis]AZE88214.1 hypothetical protein C4J97_1499 [Pseudomonas orientalis]AZE93623.1 hypothetical protein C4J96_1491 [Pseudomonas orientalis]AZE98977.1 hypothetical protein C4J95_1501 [Pseudomonas orientalis]
MAMSERPQGYASCHWASSRRNVAPLATVNLLRARRTAP